MVKVDDDTKKVHQLAREGVDLGLLIFHLRGNFSGETAGYMSAVSAMISHSLSEGGDFERYPVDEEDIKRLGMTHRQLAIADIVVQYAKVIAGLVLADAMVKSAGMKISAQDIVANSKKGDDEPAILH